MYGLAHIGEFIRCSHVFPCALQNFDVAGQQSINLVIVQGLAFLSVLLTFFAFARTALADELIYWR
jgi:hypothetical protein